MDEVEFDKFADEYRDLHAANIKLSGNVNLHQLHSLDIDHLGVESIFFQQPGFFSRK